MRRRCPVIPGRGSIIERIAELALSLADEVTDMKLGVILETNDPERVWNGFRLANTALDAGHSVAVFLLGDGVTAPDQSHQKFNPRGVIRKFALNGGELLACGTCLDSRGIEPDDLRPRATMADCLGVVEESDTVLTIG